MPVLYSKTDYFEKMKLEDIIIIAILVLIATGICLYIYKEKKKGNGQVNLRFRSVRIQVVFRREIYKNMEEKI